MYYARTAQKCEHDKVEYKYMLEKRCSILYVYHIQSFSPPRAVTARIIKRPVLRMTNALRQITDCMITSRIAWVLHLDQEIPTLVSRGNNTPFIT